MHGIEKFWKLYFEVLTFALVVLLFSTPSLSAGDDAFVVGTSSGQLRGVARSTGGAEFLGIPFAQPPVGKLRWHEPIAVEPWTDVRDASKFGAPCAQPVLGDWNRHDAETSKEDCLFLNVMIPKWPPQSKLPVMFWLHGGANAGGTASAALYKDGTLVQHGIVLVTVNYRLGVLGFFAHPALTSESEHKTSGNYGLMDQIAALRWVKKNIAKFGGDPDNITVFGQSAGAQDTSLLMTSPLARDLFARAIVESGSAFMSPLPPLENAEKAGEALATNLKAPEGNSAADYLRGLSVSELLDAASKQDPNAPPMLGPILDGYVITDNPAGVFAKGSEAHIPLLIGTTNREFSFDGPPDALRKFIEQFAGELAPRAMELYGLANGGAGQADPLYGSVGNQWLADQIFRCPVTAQAISHNDAKNAVYEYQLEHAIPGQEKDGAVHSADLPYVFGFYPKTGNIAGPFGEVDFRIADWVETYWSNFARTGDPNGASVPKWPEFGKSQNYISITQDGQVIPHSGGLRPQQCKLYRNILEARKKPSNH
ncbi:MAG TPA: carboxylesterase family protein [Terriglobales bacterium]|nr:carboxylesterase family protein [Terriglobales bacterium]